jgi:hypothetical protein
MTRELETAIERIKALPESEQAQLGDRLNGYLNKLDDLRTAVQLGIDSLERGEGIPADEVFDRLEAKYRAMGGGAAA